MKAKTFLRGLGLGAGIMYWLDPRQGRRRRARLQDQWVHMTHCASDFVDRGVRDLTNRVNGVVHEAKCLFTTEEADDRILEERVRAKLGRYVSHPHAIGVSADDGRVILSGPILEHEVSGLLAAIESVRGVNAIDSRLDVHEHAGNISSLQGGVEPGREPIDVMQENWSPATRLVASGLGTALMLNCLARRTPGAVLLGTLGFGLFARATSNMSTRRLIGADGERPVFSVQKTYHVAAPVDRVFEFLTDREQSARLMTHVKDVHELGNGRVRWTLGVPGTKGVELEGVVTDFEPNRLVAWKSTPDSPVACGGRIRFEPEGDNRTLVELSIGYNPPAGIAGHLAAAFAGWDPKTQIEESFVRIKSYLESGKLPHDVEKQMAREHEQAHA